MTDKQQVREIFRHKVFERDHGECVVPWCNELAVDAHHIIERRLWKEDSEDGGYLVDNGVSLCKEHHKGAEEEWIPPDALRLWAGITNRIIPRQLDPFGVWSKWGRRINTPNRSESELVKYPHTPYFSFSPSNDLADVEESGFFNLVSFVGKPIVATVKMDGSQLIVTHDKVTARNARDAPHKSFDMAKQWHSTIAHLIPKHIQVFGEWLYAKHSIHYHGDLALSSFLQVFAVYDRLRYLWMDWEDVIVWANALGVPNVPVVGHIKIDSRWSLQSVIEKAGYDAINKGHEGIVVRSKYPFYYGDFHHNVAKFVRPDHVQTDKHWSRQAVVRNELKKTGKAEKPIL